MRTPLLVFMSGVLLFLAAACEQVPAASPANVEMTAAEPAHLERRHPETVTSTVEKPRARSEAPQQRTQAIADSGTKEPAGLAEIAIFRKVNTKKLPATLLGLPRTESAEERRPDDYETNSYQATYTDGNQRVQVTLVDAPGQLDPALIRTRWMVSEPTDSTADYQRIIDLQGREAYETYQAADDRHTLTLLVDNRYLIQVEAYGVAAEAVRDACAQLGF